MDALQQDQEFLAGRLAGDSYFADVKVLQQRKGVTEADINQALSVLLAQGGKIGACVIILKPALIPSEADAPGPEYRVSLSVQVITFPLVNDGDDGTKKSTEEIAERVRLLGHRFATPGGTFSFAGMLPEEVEAGKDSYSVTFTRRASDSGRGAGLPLFTPDEGAVPQAVELTSAEADEIWYTFDGSYPSPSNEFARKYVAPIPVSEAGTLLAVAYKDGLLPSGLARATYG